MARFHNINGNRVQFTEAEETARDVKEEAVLADQQANAYKTNRAREYPSIGDQLDNIYHNGLTKWKADMITPVKEKYPKPD